MFTFHGSSFDSVYTKKENLLAKHKKIKLQDTADIQNLTSCGDPFVYQMKKKGKNLWYTFYLTISFRQSCPFCCFSLLVVFCILGQKPK